MCNHVSNCGVGDKMDDNSDEQDCEQKTNNLFSFFHFLFDWK